MQKNINSIVHMFPEFEKNIGFLFQTDENFQDLCKDYLICARNVMEMKKESDKCKKQMEEYEDLRKELEQEILYMIMR
jgi:hypothetical protein